MISAQQESFCVLHFSKTKSVISVQRAFKRRFVIAASSAKNIRHWYKQFEGQAACAKGRAQATKDFGGGSIRSLRDVFAKLTKVHPPCKSKIWPRTANCMECIKTTFSHATILPFAHGTSPSCWRQRSVWNLVMTTYEIWKMTTSHHV